MNLFRGRGGLESEGVGKRGAAAIVNSYRLGLLSEMVIAAHEMLVKLFGKTVDFQPLLKQLDCFLMLF